MSAAGIKQESSSSVVGNDCVCIRATTAFLSASASVFVSLVLKCIWVYVCVCVYYVHFYGAKIQEQDEMETC